MTSKLADDPRIDPRIKAVFGDMPPGMVPDGDVADRDEPLAYEASNLHFELEHSEHLKGLPPEIWRSGAGLMLISADFRNPWRLLAKHLGVADPTSPGASVAEKIDRRRQAVASFLATLMSWDAVEQATDKMNLAWGVVRAGMDLEQDPTVPGAWSATTSQVRGPASRRGEHKCRGVGRMAGNEPCSHRRTQGRRCAPVR